MAGWDQEVDFLVMGSGAAGMAAAIRAHDLGLRVLLVEKSDLFGGNTAMSGGVCWVPNNPDMKRVGIPDSDEDAFVYLKHITKGEVPDDKLRVYIRESKRMLDYFEKNTLMRYRSLAKYTDYYPEAPGGREGGRSMDPVPFDGARLREHLMTLRRPHDQSQILGKFGITAQDAHNALGLGPKTFLFMAWQMLLYFFRYFKRRRWGRDTKLCAGNSVIGRLLHSSLERDITMWRNTSVSSLILEEGRVVGAVIDKEGTELRIRAKKGVLLGAGGFSRNQEMRDKYQRKPILTDWTAGSPSNTGDGIQLGLDAGGQVEFMDEAWWTPVAVVPKTKAAWVLVVEKSLPHGMFVNQNGKRFVNEAAPYIDVVVGMYEDAAKHGSDHARWFHVFDATYRKTSVTGPVAPGKVMPDSQLPRRYRDGHYLYKANTLEELADKIQIPAIHFQATIERFNVHAIKGEDPDFNRGWSAQDRYYGNPNVKPNCALGPVKDAPFYAVQIFPGDLGTKGGLITDNDARVLDQEGNPIPGLFAAGNNSSPVMGRTYPGAGGTIGPAFTFGFLAAEAAANAEASRDQSIETGSISTEALAGAMP